MLGAEEMVHGLREHATVEEDPSSIPKTQARCSQSSIIPASGDMMTSGFYGHLHSQAHFHTETHNLFFKIY